MKNSITPHEDTKRFTRQLMLPEVGEAGQNAINTSRILIIGLGGLGSPISLYLAAAGIGVIGLVDDDVVDISNLHRQILYRTDDIGKKKTDIALRHLKEINPNIEIKIFSEKFTSRNALNILCNYDIVIDGTDNFNSHYLINDACVLANKILIYGNVFRYEGQLGIVRPYSGPCYRCLYPTPAPKELAPSCADAGVLGPVPGLIGTLQALETLKIILKINQENAHHLFRFDTLKMKFSDIKISRDLNCSLCGEHPTIVNLEEHKEMETCTRDTNISADQLQRELMSDNPPFLLDVRSVAEYESGHLKKAHLIPLPILPEKMNELNKSIEIVVYCHAGIRSAHALALLKSNGFTKIRHLIGGIEAMEEAGHI